MTLLAFFLKKKYDFKKLKKRFEKILYFKQLNKKNNIFFGEYASSY